MGVRQFLQAPAALVVFIREPPIDDITKLSKVGEEAEARSRLSARYPHIGPVLVVADASIGVPVDPFPCVGIPWKRSCDWRGARLHALLLHGA